MREKVERQGYAIPPMDEIEGEGPQWDELRRLDGEARRLQIEALELGMSPDDSEEYVEAEARFKEFAKQLSYKR
jgi:branched-subunit amino acid aminotransferase/4-amino-4-deoxychorismate lyase